MVGEMNVKTLDEVEREHIIATLDAADGNMTKAARALGIDRRTLYRKAHSYGLFVRRWRLVRVGGEQG